eukprot:PLAT16179.1.p2 GENE.PLAT16179.1~~PLAT16179.1.p2  ORF type:complete len:138 (+),score=55.78 PLAT16179.1:76-489(+)
MHTAWQRAMAVFSFAVTVAMFLAAAAAVTSPVLEQEAIVNRLAVTNIAPGIGRGRVLRDEVEVAQFQFDLQADLRPLFHWNVKQLFIWVSAEYETDSHEVNQVVVWDSIITKKEQALLDLKDVDMLYLLTDHASTLK